jgi:hypothetical protein
LRAVYSAQHGSKQVMLLDTSTVRLNTISVFDEEERLPAGGRGVEKNPLCSKEALMDFI